MLYRYFFTLLALFATAAWADEIHVAVAANFTAPMNEIAIAFEKASGHKLILSYGATGKFHTQIRQGAPFDVLLAADDETPAQLEKDGLGVAGTRLTYATGKLVLWSAKSGYVDIRGEILKTAAFTHLALANPRQAPYGRATVETLQALGLMTGIQPKFVQAESIAQAYQFVATGNAELGFIALSQICRDNKITQGSAWIVPANLYQPIRQDAVLLSHGAGKAAAKALLDYLRGEQARTIIKAYCYEL